MWCHALVRLNVAGTPGAATTPNRSFNFETEFEIRPHGASVLVGHRDSESRVAATLSSPPHYM